MQKFYSTFLVFFSIMLILGGFYVYFAQGLNAQADSSLQSSADPVSTTVDSSYAPDSEIIADTAFLSTLASLKKITIDTTFFDDKAFKMLVNNGVVLESIKAGRENPFAPVASVSQGVDTVLVSPIVTGQASKVTKNSVLLSGTVTITNNAIATTYFEYGPTDKFGKITPPQNTQSLIGAFVAPIAGLVPNTTYSYRAVARINNVVSYGDTAYFTTN